MYGLGLGAGLPVILTRTSAALAAQALEGTSIEKHPNRILVVIELSGGNDGLNTVVPFGDATYYQARPKLGIPEREVIKLADGYGFHPSMVGFERLYKDGRLAVVHGCGYEHPSLSHFSSMGFWHTGVPNGGESLGWLGRLADQTLDGKQRNLIVNLGTSQSLAVRSRQHSPLVFDDPTRFRREGTDVEKQTLAELSQMRSTSNPTLDFLASTAHNATESWFSMLLLSGGVLAALGVRGVCGKAADYSPAPRSTHAAPGIPACHGSSYDPNTAEADPVSGST